MNKVALGSLSIHAHVLLTYGLGTQPPQVRPSLRLQALAHLDGGVRQDLRIHPSQVDQPQVHPKLVVPPDVPEQQRDVYRGWQAVGGREEEGGLPGPA